MLDDFAFSHVLFLDEMLDAVVDFRQALTVRRLDVLADNLEGIAILDRLVVVVGVQIVAEDLPGGALLLKQWSASEGDLDGVRVGFEQVSEEAALGVVATMRLVDDEDTLQIGGISGHVDPGLVLGEPLDVDHRYFGSATLAFK